MLFAMNLLSCFFMGGSASGENAEFVSAELFPDGADYN
ncbi:hypothetical protein SFMTTN_2091 [Sulfuriferula multivorans]|uniref:Uncharacterized protein n=1 Tax=Sulfuriferula multivorans TaxID=1559896 RepID=A0A401JF98_9PROT|nr:hypothetical protein SFMTTN_2091 [Sulfuriferula multivorans]